jgi:NADH:ubiquinone oxidoreductase subunit 6 (subunit J)
VVARVGHALGRREQELETVSLLIFLGAVLVVATLWCMLTANEEIEQRERRNERDLDLRKPK